jgi:NTE family protein
VIAVTPHRTSDAPEAGSGRPPTAFVLSGGLSQAALQVGMLQALYERGITPDFLVATSAGAFNAAFVASRPQTAATATELARVWGNLRREDIFPVSMTALVGGVCSRRDHLVPARGLRTLVRKYVELEDLADAAVPLHLAVFDLNEERELLLSEGPAVEAVVAAASIPGVFPPAELAGRRLVDASIVNNTPIRHAVELGAERIYVLPTRDPRGTPACIPEGALDVAIYGLATGTGSRLADDISRYSRAAELIVLPVPDTARVAPTSFEDSERLIGDALFAARALLASQRRGKHLRLV